MKKMMLSIALVAFAAAVQAGDTASCPAAKSACCASEAKATTQTKAACSATAQTKAACSATAEVKTKCSATTQTASTASCCSKETKAVAKQTKPLASPKFASK